MRMKEENSRNKSRGRKQMWNKVISQVRGDNENWCSRINIIWDRETF